MRVDDLEEILVRAEVDPTYHCLLGDGHDALCLVPHGQS